ncbi:MAG: indole-3-glycerol phosphate synthase TrpC [Verrucomicrobiota bacterium]|nr:indole-3-glycerol phosphate synthase TrpC [Verrucomicrobiota bacterium]
MNRLQEILDAKKKEIARLLPRAAHLRAGALLRNDFRSLSTALKGDGLSLIAEVKKASPSAGPIVESFDPVAIAIAYELAGAHAVSVLTDEQFFHGSLSHLVAVRGAISPPVLRKDFVLHEAQIFEAACAGADAILLIVAALDQPQLEALFAAAELCQLEALVEVHSARELDRALDLGAHVIGINNRNLETFEVDLVTTETLSEDVPDDAVLVSESGIKTAADAARMRSCGVDAILVGESLMRSADAPALIKAMIS